MRASKLDFTDSRFTQKEFPEGVLEEMDASVIQALLDVRASIPMDHFLYPSPLYGAHVRDDGSGSRHNTRGGRLSDATDFFCLRGQLALVVQTIGKHPKINGFGVYKGSVYRGNVDMWAMVHIDTRPEEERVYWVAEKVGGKYLYTYMHRNPKKYFKILSEVCR